MPSVPRLACTVTSTCLPAEAECTQASLPATRNPVSSKCATSEAISACTISLIAGLQNAAIFLAIAATAPGDGSQPNMSPRAWQARSRDRNCPCHRYAASAEARGPYCTGAFTPSGACALVACPQHAHVFSIIWCSVTVAFTWGISVTCRRSIPVCSASARPAPHPEHAPGSCRITRSG